MKRVCDYCKKPMFNSWAGEWVGKKFIEVHEKCKTEWKKGQTEIAPKESIKSKEGKNEK